MYNYVQLCCVPMLRSSIHCPIYCVPLAPEINRKPLALNFPTPLARIRDMSRDHTHPEASAGHMPDLPFLVICCLFRHVCEPELLPYLPYPQIIAIPESFPPQPCHRGERSMGVVERCL